MKITRAQFLATRSPRRGTANPERHDEPLWLHLIETGETADAFSERFDGPDSVDAGPAWCFERFGRTKTTLPDGRVLLIGGEYEDSYMPDFYIYNDVVVIHPDGRTELFGYDPAYFPPTDFHSATLVGDRVLLVGNLGYEHGRMPGTTQLCALDIGTLAITPIETHGEGPGWISDHVATLNESGNALLVSGGEVLHGERFFENHSEWALCLETWSWSCTKAGSFEQWRVERADRDDLYLSDMNDVEWEEKCREFRDEKDGVDCDDETDGTELVDEPYERELWDEITMDSRTRLEMEGRKYDLETLAALYVPRIHHLILESPDDDDEEDEDEGLARGGERSMDAARIAIDGVTVRYHDDDDAVLVKIEGALPAATVESLLEDLRAKLEVLQDSKCVCSLELRLPE